MFITFFIAWKIISELESQDILDKHHYSVSLSINQSALIQIAICKSKNRQCFMFNVSQYVTFFQICEVYVRDVMYVISNVVLNECLV